ncbi:MAG: HD family hydrolase [Spirochaetales bacterium]|nr:HD family hydrolase [Spirochaetales bacterium]
MLNLLREAGALKNLPRSGWLLRGVRNPESIADHCFRVTLLCMLLVDDLLAEGERLDAERVLRMAVLHELGEARLGDIPYTAGRWLGESAKEQAEERAVCDLLAPLQDPRQEALWREFSGGSTREARLVRAADKLEMMIQAWEYEQAGARTLQEFFANPANRPHFEEFPLVQEIASLLEARRPPAARQPEGDSRGQEPGRP